MIDALTFDMNGSPLHITRGKMLQCFIFRYQLAFFDEVFDDIFQNWNTLFPTVNEFRVDLPMKYYEAFDEICNKMRAAFARFGEDIPSDEEVVKSQALADPMHVDCFRLAETYWERACEIVERATLDFENAPQSNISGNVGFVGFGIGGMIGAALANTATDLLDRGINRLSDEMKLRKYKEQLNELLHGEKTINEFVTVAALMVQSIFNHAIIEIAAKTDDDIIFCPDEEKTVLESSQYKALSREEKIAVCIECLERYPAEGYFYDELVKLTKGKIDSLVIYGDTIIDDDYGAETRQKVAKDIFDSAAHMNENKVEEIESKISSMEELLDIYEEKEVIEREIARLAALKKQKKYADETCAMVSETMSMLDKISILEISSQKELQKDGFFVFLQEIFICKNNYENLPDDAMIQKCAALGNGIPLLLKMEAKGLDGRDAIKSWTYWARKGNPYALMRLGLCRLHRNGVEKDTVRSRQLLLQAAETNYIPAWYILYQIAVNEYKPNFGHPTPEDKKYEYDLKNGGFSEEIFEKYKKFGRRSEAHLNWGWS